MSSIPFNRNTSLGTSKGKEMPKLGHTEIGNSRTVARRQLIKSFGNLYNNGLGTSPALYNKNILGPFRTATNAGDVITNQIEPTNKLYGLIPNQVGGNNLARVSGHKDGIKQGGNAMYSGNPRYVYDGSDYIKFKRLQAINKTFNDKSHGGNNNSNQQILRRVRS